MTNADDRCTCCWRLKVDMYESTSRVYRRNHGCTIRTVRPNSPPFSKDKLIGRYPGYTSATPLPPAGTNPGAKAFSVTFASPAQAEAALGQTKGFLMQPGWEMGVSKA